MTIIFISRDIENKEGDSDAQHNQRMWKYRKLSWPCRFILFIQDLRFCFLLGFSFFWVLSSYLIRFMVLPIFSKINGHTTTKNLTIEISSHLYLSERLLIPDAHVLLFGRLSKP